MALPSSIGAPKGSESVDTSKEAPKVTVDGDPAVKKDAAPGPSTAPADPMPVSGAPFYGTTPGNSQPKPFKLK